MNSGRMLELLSEQLFAIQNRINQTGNGVDFRINVHLKAIALNGLRRDRPDTSNFQILWNRKFEIHEAINSRGTREGDQIGALFFKASTCS